MPISDYGTKIIWIFFTYNSKKLESAENYLSNGNIFDFVGERLKCGGGAHLVVRKDDYQPIVY